MHIYVQYTYVMYDAYTEYYSNHLVMSLTTSYILYQARLRPLKLRIRSSHYLPYIRRQIIDLSADTYILYLT